MKLSKFANPLVIALVLSVAAFGCRHKPQNVTPLPEPYTKNVKDTGPTLPDRGRSTGPDSRITSQPIGPVTPEPDKTGGTPLGPGHPGWGEEKTILKADTVYFDFDSSVVKGSEKPKVSAVADYLKANAINAVRIEGNCDERGTEEYNRALGDRRALAVREELISMGVAPDRVDSKTWGKDNPENDPGHDDAAYKKNRRDEFIVLTPPGKP
jgi:peptidoglycan-associated lipoprotein